MVEKCKVLLICVVIGSLLLSLPPSFNMVGARARRSFASPAGVTVTDFWTDGGREPWGITFDSRGDVWVAVPGCDPNPSCNGSVPPGKIEEYDPGASTWIASYQLPPGYGQPLFLAFDKAGNLCFPMPTTNAIGMLDPASHAFRRVAVPTAGAGPWDLVIDKGGNVWFTEHYTNKIGRLDAATGTISEFATPSPDSQPYGITVDAAGNIWFTENTPALARIGEYTNFGTINEYTIRANPPPGLMPHLISVDPGGNIWWTEGWVGMLGELHVAEAIPGTNSGVAEYAYPAPCSTCHGTHASGIAIDGSGQVWFDDSLQGIIGSFPDTGKGTFAEYLAPTPNGHPHDGLNVDSHNRIWFTEEFASKLAEALQSGAPTPLASPPPPAGVAQPVSPEAIVAQDTFERENQAGWGTATDGQIWEADSNTSGAFSVVSGSGRLAYGSGPYTAVLGPTVTDAEVLFSGSISSYANASLGAVLRWAGSNDWYRATLFGTALVVQKDVAGSTTILGSAAFHARAGASYTLRFRVVGTTLYARAWQTGAREPRSWQIIVTDNALTSGHCGLRVLLQNGAAATFTSFLASRVP